MVRVVVVRVVVARTAEGRKAVARVTMAVARAAELTVEGKVVAVKAEEAMVMA